MSKKLLNWGTRHVRIFKLDSAGEISVDQPTGYLQPYRQDGYHILGATSFQMTEPPPRTIDHPGDDSVIGSDSMPALSGETAQITASPWDLDLVALLENTKVSEIGSGYGLARGTNKAGSEPRFASMFYQQAIEADDGSRKWHCVIYPSAKITPIGNGGADSPQPTQFQVTSTNVTTHLWGAPLTVADDGCTRMRKMELYLNYEPVLFRCVGDDSRTEFLFDTNYPAYSADEVTVWKNGVLMGSGYTATTLGVTFDAAVLTTDLVVVLYGKASES